jgi:F-type H+-transporting ATPase subunit epsilon
MAAFHFELVSPEKLLFSGAVESVVAPGADGQFTVLKDHAPVMTTLKPGVVSVAAGDGKVEKLFVRGGFADVSAGGFTVLAEQAIPLAEIDVARLEADIKDAR